MRTLVAACLIVIAGLGAARADDLTVVSSGGFMSALRDLAPAFEAQTGNHLVILGGPSMGATPNAVPQRLARGEKLDVLVMVGSALDALAGDGKVSPASEAVIGLSDIGVAVRAGAPHPDISTEAALKAALLGARSVAYSDSASGVYVGGEMFKRMGIADAMAGRAHMIPATPVGEIVARGEADIGFQQISELRPVAGIDLLGPLPPELQLTTVYKAGIVAGTSHAAQAERLVRFLASPDAAAVIAATGMRPPS